MYICYVVFPLVHKYVAEDAFASYSVEEIYYCTILFIKGRKATASIRELCKLDANASFLLQIHVVHVAIYTPAVGMDV